MSKHKIHMMKLFSDHFIPLTSNEIKLNQFKIGAIEKECLQKQIEVEDMQTRIENMRKETKKLIDVKMQLLKSSLKMIA